MLAAGRNGPREVFVDMADAYRPGDGVCVEVLTKENPDILPEDVRMLVAFPAEMGSFVLRRTSLRLTGVWGRPQTSAP